MPTPHSHTGAAGTAARPLPFEVVPLHPRFGAEIRGITLEDAVGEAMFAAVWQVFLERQLILFRDVDLPPEVQVAFARRFGEVQVHVMNQYHGYSQHPEIYLLTNLGEDGKPTGKHPDEGTVHWHTDGSWRDRTGLATMMYSERVPAVGGETWFCDMYGAYDEMPEARRAELAGMRAFHNLDFSRTRRHGVDPMTEAQKKQVPPVAHSILRTHPDTGRKAIFLGDHAEWIDGMDYDAGRDFIEALNREITPDHLVYKHSWSPRQCIVWDNRCLLHRATGYDVANEIRVMRRCTTLGDKPTP